MREELQQKLTARLRQERFSIILLGALFTLIASMGYLNWTLPYEPAKHVSGTLRYQRMLSNSETQKQTIELGVLLDDRRYATATATFRQIPAVGSRIALREEVSVLGFHHYYWDGLLPDGVNSGPYPNLHTPHP